MSPTPSQPSQSTQPPHTNQPNVGIQPIAAAAHQAWTGAAAPPAPVPQQGQAAAVAPPASTDSYATQFWGYVRSKIPEWCILGLLVPGFIVVWNMNGTISGLSAKLEGNDKNAATRADGFEKNLLGKFDTLEKGLNGKHDSLEKSIGRLQGDSSSVDKEIAVLKERTGRMSQDLILIREALAKAHAAVPRNSERSSLLIFLNADFARRRLMSSLRSPAAVAAAVMVLYWPCR